MLATFHVSVVDGDDGFTGGTNDPFRSIQAAIVAASSANDGPDVINVAGGTYNTPGVDVGIGIANSANLTNLQLLGGWDLNFGTRDPDATPVNYYNQVAVDINNPYDVDISDADVTVDGFSFYFRGDAISGTRTGAGIVTKATNTTISNNRLIVGLNSVPAPSGRTPGVQSGFNTDVSGLQVLNNEFDISAPAPSFTLSAYGVYLNPGPIARTSPIVISGNTFAGNNMNSAVVVDEDGGVEISSNTINRTSAYAPFPAGVIALRTRSAALEAFNDVTITDNTIVNTDAVNATAGIALGVTGQNQVISNVTITGNLINVAAGPGIFASSTVNAATTFINLNSVQAATAGQYVVSATPGLEVSGNYLGSNVAATANANLLATGAGSVLASSFLSSGADANASVAGLQLPTTTEMLIPQTAATSGLAKVDGRIQTGIDRAAAGMTVRVAADTYSEDLIVAKELTLLGAQAGVDARGRAATETVIESPTGGLALQITAADVAVDGFQFVNGLVRASAANPTIENNLFTVDAGALNGTLVGSAAAVVDLAGVSGVVTVEQNSIVLSGNLAAPGNSAGYTLNPLDGQQGWSGGAQPNFTNNDTGIDNGDGTFGDEKVTDLQSYSGTQSWRYSRGYGSPGQGTPFSPNLGATVGAPSFADGDTATVRFAFKAVTAGDGTVDTIYEGTPAGTDRTGAQIGLENTPAGVRLFASTYNPTTNAFDSVTLGTFPAATWHTVEYTTVYNDNPALDLTTYIVDGTTVGSLNPWMHIWRQDNAFNHEVGSRLKFSTTQDNNTAIKGFYYDDLEFIISDSSNPGVPLAQYSTGFEASSAPTQLDGIKLSGNASSLVSLAIANNDLDGGSLDLAGASTGIAIAASTLAGTVAVTGNEVTGFATGVSLAASNSATIAGNNFNSAGADNTTDVRIDSGATGVTFGSGNQFAGDTYFVDNRSALSIDLTAAGTTFEGLNSATLADNFRIEDKMFHALDSSTSGVITWVADTRFVTTPGTGASDETIQRAVNAASPGDTVRVEAGTYNENVAVNKTGVQLLGAGAAMTSIVGQLVGAGVNTVQLSAADVVLDGFTITRLLGVNENNIGVGLSSLAGIEVRNNVITGNRTAIYVNGGSSVTITGNVIDDNRTGILFADATHGTHTITENAITNNRTFGVLLLPSITGWSADTVISGNNISGNFASQLENNGSVTINASGNWWGTETPTLANLSVNAALPPVFNYPGPASQPASPYPYFLSGSNAAGIDFSPNLNSGTDTAPATPGFQGDFSSITVHLKGAQTGTAGRIQEGVDVVSPAGTIIIETGAYAGNVDATAKSATLQLGVGIAQVAINGNLVLDANDALAYEVNGNAPGTYDQLQVNGTVALGGASLLISGSYTATPNDIFTLIDNDLADPVSGIFAGSPAGGLVNVNGYLKQISYTGGTGNDVVLLVPLGNGGVVPNPDLPGQSILVINGTAKSDAIVVRKTSATEVTVYIAPKVSIGVFPLASFDSILINAFAGNDSIVIEAPIDKPSTIYGDSGNDAISGGSGPDIIVGGEGNDSIVGNVGDDTFIGGPGNDKIVGGAGFDKYVAPTGAAIVSGTVVRVGTSSATYAQIEQIEVTGTGAAENFVFNNVVANVLLDGQGGTDTISYTGDGNFTLANSFLTRTAGVTNSTVALTSIEKATITGLHGANTFNVTAWTNLATVIGGLGTDTIEAANDVDYTLTPTSLQRTALPNITLSAIENAKLTAGVGANTFTVNEWAGTATLAANAGTDKLVVTDNSMFTTLTNTSLTRLGRGTIGISGFEAVEITGGAAANTISGAAFSGQLKIDGAGGNDTLTGGQGATLLLGGLGNDTLRSGGGRTVMIGGVGLDRLTGGFEGDLLVAGQTVHDNNAAALAAILAEWSSGASYATRVSHLTGTAGGLNGTNYLNGPNVTHDAAVDVLMGAGGDDLFFAKLTASVGVPKDTLSDKLPGESAF
ncbi:NosD domain-containing protein [Anatilimnocola sp. NA78]|uniref:right-handed parallel beta-helix repeat-containing protein n=1 Tax=Anatilimnocola sp. NA78 TaxID=3415683 RepID=UPI003CE4BA78